ncbi:MAG: BCCT family transporter [Succinivibrionaceae bacterium]|nr:BCCT family transporter [Succinivibrionaceae bacterium]
MGNTPSKHQLNRTVFGITLAVLLLVLGMALAFPAGMAAQLRAVQQWITAHFGWFYVLSASIIFFSIVFLGLSRFGSVKLGPDHSKPDFSNTAWFAMLFSAGMGIGLLFFGVGEPLMHYLEPPAATPQSAAAARQAMHITFFHWGFTAWGIYAIVAILLAFFSFRYQLPLTLRSAFYPLLGERIYGLFGDLVDVFAVLATLFGVTTSLGYGILQINSGLGYLFGLPSTSLTQVLLIALIMVFVVISAVSGLKRGIKYISTVNILLAVLLTLLILLLGNTSMLFKVLVQNVGSYLSSFVHDTFNLYAYQQKETWLGGWTLLYWTWWLSWSPFVGLFIARISRGRTIREFVMGVLLVPTIFTCIWMTVFGNSAIGMVQEGFTRLAEVATADVSQALFVFLERFPMPSVLSAVAVLMVFLFFVTSADSGAYVIDMLCSNGKDKTPARQKVFWCCAIGIITAALLCMGGLAALQSLTMISALPLTIAILGCMCGLFKSLRMDLEKKESQNYTPVQASSSAGWEDRLNAIIDCPDARDARDFLTNTVLVVFRRVAGQFKKRGLATTITHDPDRKLARFTVGLGEEMDFTYGVRLQETEVPDYASRMADISFRAEVFLREGGQDYDVIGWSQDALINDIVEQYGRHMHFLYKIR